MDLLDEQQKRLFLFFRLREQAPGHLGEKRLRLRLVEVARYVEDNRDVPLECELGQLSGVLGCDLDVTLLVTPDVQNLVLLFQPVVLPVDIDDQQTELVVEELLHEDARAVRVVHEHAVRQEVVVSRHVEVVHRSLPVEWLDRHDPPPLHV